MSEHRIPVPAPRPTRRGALLLWVIAAAGLLFISFLAYPLSFALTGMNLQLQSLILNLIYYLPFAALPVWRLTRRVPGMWRRLRPNPISPLSTLSIAGLALLCVFFVTDLTVLWSIPLEALGLNVGGASIPLPNSAPGLMLCVLDLAVLPGICEEFLFRGVILSAFERNGARCAVLVSAALFALLHGSLTGLPSQFLLGLILGWLVICSDSIYAGLIFHTAYNAASILLQFVVSRSSAASAAAETARMLDVVGGLRGVVTLLIELALMGAMILFTLRMFRTIARWRGIPIAPRRGERLRGSELALLIVGLCLVGLLYGANIYSMLP